MYEKCNDRSNKSTVPSRPSLLLLLLSLYLSLSLEAAPLLPPLLTLPHPKMITYTQVRSVHGYEPPVCGYRYVTLVGTCWRHYPLPRRAILKIEKSTYRVTREETVWKYRSGARQDTRTSRSYQTRTRETAVGLIENGTSRVSLLMHVHKRTWPRARYRRTIRDGICVVPVNTDYSRPVPV